MTVTETEIISKSDLMKDELYEMSKRDSVNSTEFIEALERAISLEVGERYDIIEKNGSEWTESALHTIMEKCLAGYIAMLKGPKRINWDEFNSLHDCMATVREVMDQLQLKEPVGSANMPAEFREGT